MSRRGGSCDVGTYARHGDPRAVAGRAGTSSACVHAVTMLTGPRARNRGLHES
jgi:hypothetical protein